MSGNGTYSFSDGSVLKGEFIDNSFYKGTYDTKTELGQYIYSFENLTSLSLKDNNIESFPDLKGFEKIREVDISGNPIAEDEDIESKITVSVIPPLTQIIVSENCMFIYICILFICILLSRI